MSEPGPFVIKIPPGATELDLGPILRPLIFAIKGGPLLDPDKLERYWLKGKEGLEYRRLLPTISRQMVGNYLNNNGWSDEDDPPRGYSYIPSYQLKKRSWDRRGPWLRFGGGSKGELTLPTLNDFICQMAHQFNKSKLDMAKAIISNANVLDRIVAELD
jgi:hypothetical protein